MLADTIIAFPTTAFASGALSDPQKMCWRIFGEKVKRAQRFTLDRGTVRLALTVAEGAPSKWASGLGICRLPFKTTWIDFAFQDRLDWQREAEEERRLKIVQMDGAPPPVRLGFLLEEGSDKHEIIVTQAWVHDGGYASIGHLSFKIDTSPDFNIDQVKATSDKDDMLRGDEVGWATQWLRKRRELDAAAELQQRIQSFVPDFMVPVWGDIARKVSPEKFRQLEQTAIYDLRSEWRFVLAILTILNSRNVVRVDQETDLTKLNKSRAKAKKPPLLGHREIKLQLSKVVKNRLGISGDGSRDIRAHWVISHFKHRATGIFFWTAHVRGKGSDETVDPNRYKVTP